MTSDIKKKEIEKEKVLNQSYQSLRSDNKKHVCVKFLAAQERSKSLMKLNSETQYLKLDGVSELFFH